MDPPGALQLHPERSRASTSQQTSRSSGGNRTEAPIANMLLLIDLPRLLRNASKNFGPAVIFSNSQSRGEP